MRLIKCFCGGEPVRYPQDVPNAYPEELKHVYCKECGYETLSYWSSTRAARSWNFLIKGKTKKKAE